MNDLLHKVKVRYKKERRISFKNHGFNPEAIRNLVFGFEDGFVSTCGVLFGIATATTNEAYVLVAGIITVLVEASSMGIGAFLSEESRDDVVSKKQAKGLFQSGMDGIFMFAAYMIAGSICVFPYAIFDLNTAKIVSISITLIGLFFVGFVPRRNVKRGLQVVLLAGIAMLIGFVAGTVLQTLPIHEFSVGEKIRY